MRMAFSKNVGRFVPNIFQRMPQIVQNCSKIMLKIRPKTGAAKGPRIEATEGGPVTVDGKRLLPIGVGLYEFNLFFKTPGPVQ